MPPPSIWILRETLQDHWKGRAARPRPSLTLMSQLLSQRGVASFAAGFVVATRRG